MFIAEVPPVKKTRYWTLDTALIAVIVVLVICIFGYFQVRNDHEQRVQMQRALCGFMRDYGTEPVTIVRSENQPTRGNVRNIGNARHAYTGLGCGKALPPNPSWSHWAAEFR